MLRRPLVTAAFSAAVVLMFLAASIVVIVLTYTRTRPLSLSVGPFYIERLSNT